MVTRAREIVNLCDSLDGAIDDQKLAGNLTLGVVPTCLTGMMPKALASLRQAQPGLGIRVTSGPSATMADHVRKRKLDAALVSEPMDLATGLTWRPVGREPLMVIAPKGTPGKTDQELLEALPYIQFQRRTWAGQLIDLHLRERGIRAPAGMEIDSLEAIANMVVHGLGVSVVPKRKLAEDFPNEVRAVPFGDPPLFRTIGLVEPASSDQTALVSALYEELIKLAGVDSKV